MTTPARSVRPDTPAADLVPLMSEGGLHALPVVDANGQLAGIVTQSDLIAALFQDLCAAADASAPIKRRPPLTTPGSLDEAALRAHLDAFYAKVRRDPHSRPGVRGGSGRLARPIWTC